MKVVEKITRETKMLYEHVIWLIMLSETDKISKKIKFKQLRVAKTVWETTCVKVVNKCQTFTLTSESRFWLID